MPQLFRERLTSGGVIVCDGAMGSMLEPMGLLGKPDANLVNAEAVLLIHRAYVRAGAEVLLTNTLTANGKQLEHSGNTHHMTEINRAGVEIARKAAGDGVYVLGDMSSTGKLLLMGEISEDEMVETFQRQAETLIAAGVDGIMIETMGDLEEAGLAVRAVRSASTDIPIVASMAFDTDERGGRTFMQNSATECAERLAREGADVIGANCGTASPAQLAQVIRILRASTTLPLAVQMNAGGAHHQEGSAAAYNMSPSTFADEMRSCNAAGADFLGGCCGTTPEHIEALVQAVRMK